jgi:hypothetical protein
MTYGGSPVSQAEPIDPFVEAILKQEVLEKKPKSATLKPDAVVKEVPFQTPLGQARSIMEKHGFTCWSGVSDTYGRCLQCTAYKPTSKARADKLVVKLYYDRTRIIVNALVTVDYNVPHTSH